MLDSVSARSTTVLSMRQYVSPRIGVLFSPLPHIGRGEKGQFSVAKLPLCANRGTHHVPVCSRKVPLGADRVVRACIVKYEGTAVLVPFSN